MKAIRWLLKLMLVMITLPLILAVWLAKWFVVFLHSTQYAGYSFHLLLVPQHSIFQFNKFSVKDFLQHLPAWYPL